MTSSTSKSYHASAARRLERAVLWCSVAAAWFGLLLGVIVPRLGDDEPGLFGPIGFLSELVVAGWAPGGWLALAIVAIALARRHRRPALAMTPVAVGVLLSEFGPVVVAPGPQPTNAPTLTVAAVNLAAQNDHDPSMEAELRSLDADVLVLSECTRTWLAHLESWFKGDYPHRAWFSSPDRPGYVTSGFQLAIWSRRPTTSEPEVHHLAGDNPQVRVTLRLGDRELAIYGVHPLKPFPYSLFRVAWRDRRKLLRLLQAEPLPMIVAGDFNAPPRSALMVALRRIGLSIASEEVHGRAHPTWPMRPARHAPLRVAIDHVMVGEELRAVSAHRGGATRSDHAAVIATLTWRDP